MISVHVQTAGFAYHRGQGGYAPVRAGGCVVAIETQRRRAAPSARAGQLATGLAAPICDGRPANIAPLAATEAERGFSLGNAYLQGQIIDRSI